MLFEARSTAVIPGVDVDPGRYIWHSDGPVIYLHVGSEGATNESKPLGVEAFLEAAVESKGRHSGACCRVFMLASNLSSIDRVGNKNKNSEQN